VVFDYGTVNNGTFTADNTIGLGGTTNIVMPGNGNWGLLGQETLKNPLPTGASVRARLLQKQSDGSWQPKATTYMPLLVPNPGGC
jgi:hypothetical protein